MSFYEHSARDIDGNERSLSEFEGKALVVVNVASRCGFTPQYNGLEALYEELRGSGLEVLGFPCNQFGAQEPASEARIKEFCSTKFSVSFPMFSKIEVNGPNRHPVYAWLTAQATSPQGAGDIVWNFAKFVIDRKGNAIARFSPTTDPSDPSFREAVERALAS